jgi:hypothetical protein
MNPIEEKIRKFIPIHAVIRSSEVYLDRKMSGTGRMNSRRMILFTYEINGETFRATIAANPAGGNRYVRRS